ncbi:MAG: tRNA adenosine(34) deaminase TadA [Clostridia bacterium]|jgi:tRNA(adenine34) deaminase|nr:tRNA adenosine(34) deaminase TadA [Clostridia bacterium]
MDHVPTPEDFMREALKEAEAARRTGEVPIGAVVVRGSDIVGRGHNRRETGKDALAHAELEAIHDACKTLGGWRLWQCDLYVTLEPCPMCAGAIINSRIQTVYYGAKDPKAGSCGSVVNLFELPYNHKPTLVPGILEPECSEILSVFFRELREQRSRGKAE